MTQAVILTMVGSKEQGKLIAHNLVEAKLAACVNIIEKATSCEEAELLLIIKTESSNFAEVKERILSLHEYELPEVIMFNIDKGYDEYLKWITANS